MKIRLDLKHDPAKYIASALALGTVSNLENIICSIGGGKMDRRSFCAQKMDALRDTILYLPASLERTFRWALQQIQDVILNLERLDNLSFDTLPYRRLSLRSSRGVLSACALVDQVLQRCKVMMMRELDNIPADILTSLSEIIADLRLFVENVPSNIDMALRLHVNKVLRV